MNALPSNRRTRLLLPLTLCLSIGGGLVAFTVLTLPVSASIFGTATPATSQEIVWAYANVPKPTYTPVSFPVSVPTAMPTVTAISDSMVMEIVNSDQASNVNQEQASGFAYSGSKYILVDISEQHMYVYEADALIYSFVASTGIDNATRAGIFQVQSKYPSAYGSTWNIWMPSWLGIYYSGGLENGIHALPILPNGATLWAGFLGRPVSYGCVVLGSYEAQLLYDWAELGTPVEIRW
ncbi:MAG TPA: L,D-transpeptidase [Anaerolineales bacterium]|nr:L,D-transpeptidase [Anaerolineales bacterium]